MPAWPVTVSQALYDEVANDHEEPFADSYLWGATLIGDKLTPRTVTAWERLNRQARKALSRAGVTLVKPEPFASRRGGSQRSWTEVAPEAAPTRKRRPGYDTW